MRLKLWQVDAFAQKPLEGNPAAIVPLEHFQGAARDAYLSAYHAARHVLRQRGIEPPKSHSARKQAEDYLNRAAEFLAASKAVCS